MAVVKSLKNRGILLKETINKVIGQERVLLNFLGLLLRTGLPLMKNVFTLLAKSALLPLELTAASAIDAAIQKKTFGSGMTVFIVSNGEIEGNIKILKSLEESGLLIKCFSETIKD